ncbi:hypothetical protein P2G88_02560 [Aliiglaciecola sp. CAU 1673]|uniref:hypothetical protein n=1 Tax=Aliiglaciecola sp. CAU 1673 TaxID=3032595 RepID=UPI0023D9AF96|nr:hypothetical protein [Aliiglaciecola sp. CAU 1673]MDF2177125.1 hypothetical protein [Aliiglaciecola sp. CAU 1673]
MFIALIVSLCSAIFFYVEAFRTGLRAKQWGMAGLVFGPLVLPLFSVQQHMALRKVRGFGAAILRA